MLKDYQLKMLSTLIKTALIPHHQTLNIEATDYKPPNYTSQQNLFVKKTKACNDY